MRKLSLVLISLLASIAVIAQADDAFRVDQTFGGEVPLEGGAVTLTEAISGLEQGESEFVKIKGQITEVCQAKGCWMILVDGDTYARVTFENYGFFVPTETSMQRSVVYGQLSERVLSGEQAEHYAQDAGSQSSLELHGEVKEYSIVARAVQLENRS
jgi:hypothetical protein|tara:strand:+ start:33 stop:503 length:471 start_codon:yes stop_codon:yes gene_type:complete